MKLATSASAPTSAATAIALPPALAISPTVASTAALARSTASTMAPSAANFLALARPMPLPAPVTMVRLPSSRPERAIGCKPAETASAILPPVSEPRHPRQGTRAPRRRPAIKSKHQQAEPGRVRDRIGASGGIELLQDRGDMKFRRVHRDGEPSGDLLVRCAFAQQGEDLGLPRGLADRVRRRVQG